MNRLVILIIALIFINNCSLNENSRIWKDKDKELSTQPKLKKVFEKEKIEVQEFNQLLKILNPLINSQSVWKSHALYLMAEYFYSKSQKQKSKEFFNQIISLEGANPDIKLQAEKRLNRDLSE